MPDIERLLEGLTPPQREAVTHVDGPLLIVAGAGSGKTRVITRRVAHLIAQGAKPWTILAITFTNKAAAEMKTRIAAASDRPLRDFGKLDQPWPMVCTFHSLCLRILRHYAPRIGLPTNFSIFDTSDQNKVMKEVLKLLDISSANFSPSTLHGTISNAKNQLLSAEAYAQRSGDFYQRTVARVYTKYQQLLQQNNALDFDDLLLRAAQAFRDHPDLLKELQERFQYILIDEYQDTNHAQYVLAHALAMRHKNICVVGDPDQSIYAWRGADLKNILDFEKDYPDAKIVRLEQNYRSTKRVLRIASKLIDNNQQRKEKKLWTENPEGDPAILFLCQNEHDEAAAVTQKMREWHQTYHYDWSKMAIFYRMNALSRVMEDALRKAGVPYQIARGVEFYNRKEIKDALAYLRVVANPSDEVSLERIVNVPARGLGDAAIKQLSAHAMGHGMTLWDALQMAGNVAGLSPRAVKAAENFVRLLNQWRKMAYVKLPLSTVPPEHALPSPPPVDEQLFGDASDDPFGSTTAITLSDEDLDSSGSSDADYLEAALTIDALPETDAAPVRGKVRMIAEAVFRQSGLEEHLKKTGGDELDEFHNLEELISSTAEFDAENPQGSLNDFLAQVSLVSDADHMEGAGGAVTLMTLHAAKGLEFPVVAMIGLEEGILPHSRAATDGNQLEEERRLCFVGITRAQERLILSKAATRVIRGLTERTVPSPFLMEMPPEDIEIIDRAGNSSMSSFRKPGAWTKSAPGQQYIEPDHSQVPMTGEFSHLKPGQLLRHPRFGIGRLKEIEEVGQQKTRAVVRFNQGGERIFYMEQAHFEILD